MILTRSPRMVLAARSAWVVVAAAGFFASVPARADTACTQDSDCAKGFSCQTVSVPCPLAPVVVACAPGEACDASAGAPIACDGTQRSCEPGPCTTDADCADGMTCHASTTQSCSSPSCADPKQGCSTEVTCTNVTGPSTCIPKYELPCKVDSDCGGHFTCVPETVTTCWGGGGAGFAGDASTGATPGVTPTDVPPVPAEDGGSAPTSGCTTTSSGTSSCVPDMISCTADADCPTTWTCTGSTGVATAGCATVVAAVDGAVSEGPPCDPQPSPSPAPSYCVPPSYGASAPTRSSSGGTLSPDPSAPGSGYAPAGDAGSVTGSQGASAPTTPPAASGEGATASSDQGKTDGGCAVARRNADSGAALGWLLAAGLAVGLVRRRRAMAPAPSGRRR